MENLFEEKIIEVASGTKYVVIKQTVYNNKVYLLANELIDEENKKAIVNVINDRTYSDVNLKVNTINTI
mgnify:CR=1 FL=1